jgi:hypothetical protein
MIRVVVEHRVELTNETSQEMRVEIEVGAEGKDKDYESTTAAYLVDRIIASLQPPADTP